MTKLRSKFAAGLTVFAMAMFATTASAAVLSTTLGLSSSSPTVGSSVNVTGSCGAGTAAGGTVTYSLVTGSATTTLSGTATTTGTNGDFSSTVTIPSSSTTGSATLVATCPNGDTIISPVLNIQALPSANVTVTTGNPSVGGSINITGACGVGTTAGGNVTFSLVRDGVTTNLSGSATTSGVNGNFSGSVVIPSTYATGNAMLVATCPNGSTINSSTINIQAAVPGANLAVTSASPALGSTINVSGTCVGAAAGGTVTYSLVRGGVTTNISGSATTTGTNGSFSGSVVIPLTFGEGNATLVATCPNGSTINSSVLNIQALADPITLSLAPWAGTTLNISGLCTGTSAGGVTAVLLRGGVSTAVGTGTATAGANSTFNASITIPASYAGGPATLVVTCPGGETVSQLIITGGASFEDPSIIIAPTDPTAVGGVGDEGTGIIPVGGVAAGLDLAAMTALASILLALGAAALLAARHPHIRASRHRINSIGNGIRA